MRAALINVNPTTPAEVRTWHRAGEFVRGERGDPRDFSHLDTDVHKPLGPARHWWPGNELALGVGLTGVDKLLMACGTRAPKEGKILYTHDAHGGDRPVTCKRCRATKAFKEKD